MTAPVSLQNVNEIPSLLVPTAVGDLLLPTVTVAEMIPFLQPQMSADLTAKELPKWYLGSLHWRGLKVPMFSYEALNEQPLAAINSNSQVVILNSTGVHSALPFISFPTQGIPHLSRVVSDEITAIKEENLSLYQTVKVSISGSQAVIPDVSQIEKSFVNLLGL